MHCQSLTAKHILKNIGGIHKGIQSSFVLSTTIMHRLYIYPQGKVMFCWCVWLPMIKYLRWSMFMLHGNENHLDLPPFLGFFFVFWICSIIQYYLEITNVWGNRNKTHLDLPLFPENYLSYIPLPVIILGQINFWKWTPNTISPFSWCRLGYHWNIISSRLGNH